MKKLITIFALLAVLLTACAPQTPATPTPDVLATANSAASTMIALTMAAIPTATPIPPTETPPPSATTAPTLALPPTSSIPTLPPTFTPNASGEDNCIHPLNMGEAGPGHRTLIRNQTGGSVNISLNLYNPNAFGQCGAISASLAKNGSTTIELPAGDWYAYAWVTKGQKQYTSSGSFYVQPAQFDKIELCVREDGIVYKPQC
jgi:hypothetical protein